MAATLYRLIFSIRNHRWLTEWSEKLDIIHWQEALVLSQNMDQLVQNYRDLNNRLLQRFMEYKAISGTTSRRLRLAK